MALLARYQLGRERHWLDEVLTVDFTNQPASETLALVFGREAKMADYCLLASAQCPACRLSTIEAIPQRVTLGLPIRMLTITLRARS